MTRIATLASAVFMAAAAILPAWQAQAADYVAPGSYYVQDSGICAHRSVLGTITNRFRYQVRHVPNLPDVGIVDFYNIRETRYLPERQYRPIARRYCNAIVRLSDGQDRPVWYLIEYGQGFAGLGDNVEFCVSGFDRWHVYNGNCRVLY